MHRCIIQTQVHSAHPKSYVSIFLANIQTTKGQIQLDKNYQSFCSCHKLFNMHICYFLLAISNAICTIHLFYYILQNMYDVNHISHYVLTNMCVLQCNQYVCTIVMQNNILCWSFISGLTLSCLHPTATSLCTELKQTIKKILNAYNQME